MSNVNINKRGSFCSYLSTMRAFPTTILLSGSTETSAPSASSTESNGASRIRGRKEALLATRAPPAPTQLPLGSRLSCLTHASHSIAVRGFFRAKSHGSHSVAVRLFDALHSKHRPMFTPNKKIIEIITRLFNYSFYWELTTHSHNVTL